MKLKKKDKKGVAVVIKLSRRETFDLLSEILDSGKMWERRGASSPLAIPVLDSIANRLRDLT